MQLELDSQKLSHRVGVGWNGGGGGSRRPVNTAAE